MRHVARYAEPAVAVSLAFFLLACSTQIASAACLTIARMLGPGSSGDDVKQLQQFLYDDGELQSKDYVTGTYGLVTERAVRAWQIAHKIVNRDDDETTGAGIVGPVTRAALLKACDTTAGSGSWATNGPPQAAPKTTASPSLSNFFTTPTAPAKPSAGKNVATSSLSLPGRCAPMPRPSSDCLTPWLGQRGDNGCVTAWVCPSATVNPPSSSNNITVRIGTTSVSFTGQSPVILSAMGPTSLTVGATGSWSVVATNPGGGTLLYKFGWGDGTERAFEISPGATHAYNSAGDFTVTFTIQNPIGTTTQMTQKVNVSTVATTVQSPQQTPANPKDQPYGSYGGGVQGQPCFLEGQQSFTACPFMANCFQGGTYLTCHNNVWSPLQSSSANDRLSQLASTLLAIETILETLGTR